MRERNIFYNVLKNETSLTEVFCNLLDLKPFRDLFLEIIKEKSKTFKSQDIVYANFKTEVNLQDEQHYGRSDLHLTLDEDEYIFEIKIEKKTKLTDNQPNGYLNYLNNKNQNLFFIIPRNYLHLNKICERWYTKNGYEKQKILSNNIILWEDILNRIKKYELDNVNLFINEFCNIVEYRWLKYKVINFKTFEIELLFNDKEDLGEDLKMLLDTNIPKIISKLFNVVDETYKKFEIDSKSDEQCSDYYGYYLKNKAYNLNNDLDIWFGVDYEIWEKHNFPIIVQIIINNNNIIEKIKKINQLIEFEYDDGTKVFFIGLDKKIYENKEYNIVEELDILVHKVIDSLD